MAKKNLIGVVLPGCPGRTTANYVAGRSLLKVINDLKKASRIATRDEMLAGMSISKMAKVAG